MTQTSIELSKRFEQAFIYANHLHAKQVRKMSGVPYMAHLLSVAALVLEDGGSEDEAIAALLHDAVEDQGGLPTRAAIYEQFGDRVGEIVDGCTERRTLPKPPWKERKLQYLNNLRHASTEVLRVSLADKLHNVRSLLADWQWYGDRVWDEFNSSPKEKLWFYQSLVQIYSQSFESRMLDELKQLVTKLQQRVENYLDCK